jgi:DNA-binding transcriptional MerR regulator
VDSAGARCCYASIGLIKCISANYRRHGEKDLRPLELIAMYRNAGLPVADTRDILRRPGREAAAILERRLAELTGEIEALRERRRAKTKTHRGEQKS